MAERFVIVHRSYDPIQAELLGDVLREAGLAVRVVGTRSGASIGVGQVIVQVHLEVPESQAGAATDFLESYFSTSGEDLLREAGELDDDAAADEPAPRESPKSRLLAVGVALALPLGAGHAYARRPWTAALLLVGHVLALRWMVSGSWHDAIAAIAAHLLLIAFDAVGAVVALRPRAIVRPATAVGQLVVGTVATAAALLLGILIARAVPPPRHGAIGLADTNPVRLA